MSEDVEKLGKLQDYYAKYKALPSYSYMSEKFHFGAKDSVFRLIAKLKKEQFLDTAPDGKLIPGDRFFHRRHSLSSVQAGNFENDYVEEFDWVSIDEMVVKKPSITEVMDIAGPSMNGKNIFDGDKAVVELRKDAEIGEVVVAILEDGSKTVKTLGKENGKYVLVPANPDFETLRPERFDIKGVVMWTLTKQN